MSPHFKIRFGDTDDRQYAIVSRQLFSCNFINTMPFKEYY